MKEIKNKMQRGGAGSNMGGARIKKNWNGPKEGSRRYWAWRMEKKNKPNRSGSSEPDRFRI